MNRNIGLWVLIGIAGYLSFLVVHAYWQYVIFAGLFAVLFTPVHESLRENIGKTASAAIVTAGAVLLIVLPALYVAATAVQQAPGAYQAVVSGLDKESVRAVLGVTGDEVRAFAIALGEKLRANVLANAGAYLNQASNVLIGVGIMFLTTFFLLRDGRELVEGLIDIAPVKRTFGRRFFKEMHATVKGVVFGQLVTALVQGALVGVLFWALGLTNPLFWGVIAALLSVIPIFGPFFVYIPAGAYLLLQERYVAGVFMIVLGAFIISQVDNLIRPYITSRTAKVHPLIPILGVIGGLKLWGFAGFVLGPLAIAAFITLLRFSATDPHHRE